MIQILNNANEEEIAVITAAIKKLTDKDSNLKKIHSSSGWKISSRKQTIFRDLWNSPNSSIWQLETRNFNF